MSGADFLALSPLIILGAGAVLLMLLIALRRSLGLSLLLTLVVLVGALLSLPLAASWAPRRVTDLLLLDGFGLFFIGLLLLASLVGALLAYGYGRERPGEREESFVLLLLGTLGGSVLVVSNHFASLFLGLELLSVSLYGLIAYQRWRESSLEAGVKYLVLAAVSSAFLLFGLALVYAELGTMRFDAVVAVAGGRAISGLLLPGLALVFVGVGFKLAVVPFHMWTPDVYEGSPAPVTAFVATVSKGAMFAVLLRFFGSVSPRSDDGLWAALAVIAAASMLGGNLLALLQSNVKRLLAYSSISHLGYLLVAFLAGGALGATAAAFYLAAYFATTLAAFGVVGALSVVDSPRDADRLADYRGLFWRRPWLATVFGLALFSLAGIPLTGGFLGKFYLALAGLGSSWWWLVVVLVLGSAIGLFYYLRLASIMFRRPSGREATPPLSRFETVALGAVSLAILILGIYPGPFIALIQMALGLG